jgi:hypothetical protein
MSVYDWRAISQVFNQSLLKRLAGGGDLEAIARVALHSPLKDSYYQFAIGDLLDQFHGFLAINYRSEYVYKNVIAKKISMERHIHQQSRLITEFRVNQSKADTVILTPGCND